MAKKEKEEDRIERIIRGLLKLPENRRCINCNSLGPHYVCTTFLTFVCTNCSGIHREFSHRVKSVSMANFSADEVNSLQGGGNERARQIYFKDWDPQRNIYPDGSNLHRLRDFIKHVYVDRRYSGERNHDRVYRPKLGEKEESYDSRKLGPYWDGSKSPNYKDRFQNTERSSPGGRSEERILKYYERSPRYSQDFSRSGGLKKSPVRFEIVDDRVRSGRESRVGSLSSNSQKTQIRPSYPEVRSITDILGENVPSLQVGETSKTNDRMDAVNPSQNQINASSSNKESISVQAVEDKNPQSLIDFNTDSMASDAEAVSQTQENNPVQSSTNTPPAPKPNSLEFLLLELSMPSIEPLGNAYNLSKNDNPPPTTIGGNMLMTSGVSAATPLGKNPNVPDYSDVSTIPGGNVPSGSSMGLALLSSLDASTFVPGGNLATVNVTQAASMGKNPTPSLSADDTGDGMLIGGMPAASGAEQTLLLLDAATSLAPSEPAQPCNEGAPQTVIDIDSNSTFKVPNQQPVSIMQQHQLFAFPAAVDSSSGLQTNTTKGGALNNQPWTSLNKPNSQAPVSASAELSSQVVTIFQDSNSGVNSQHFPAETKSTERKELPMDLFAASYSPAAGLTPGWQNALPYGTGFSMQYHPNAVPVPPYASQLNSSNPFDFNSESSSVQVSQFPSVGNMQAALSNVSAPRSLLPSSTIPTNLSGLMETRAPYSFPPAFPSQTSASSFTSVAHSDMYMGQQLQIHAASSRGMTKGGGVGFGSNAHYGSQSMTQHAPRRYQLPSPPTSFPSPRGNPFG